MFHYKSLFICSYLPVQSSSKLFSTYMSHVLPVKLMFLAICIENTSDFLKVRENKSVYPAHSSVVTVEKGAHSNNKNIFRCIDKLSYEEWGKASTLNVIYIF